MDIQKLMKQAQQMQKQVQAKQDELADMEVTGTAAGDKVSVVMTGKYEVKSIDINNDVIDPDDADFLQDMIKSAVNDAVAKVNKMNEDEMGSITGGMGLPGM